MKLELSMEVKQEQKLSLTQEMRQSIELLQMNTYELEIYISGELDENPLLEADYKDEIDWSEFVTNMKNSVVSREKKYADEESEINPENYIEGLPSLYDHLQEELSSIDLEPEEIKTAHYIIDRINEDGYFAVEIEEAIKENHIGAEAFEKVLKKVQTMEPRGIGARNLSECILLQIDQADPYFSILEKLVTEDLDLVGAKKFTQLQKKYNLTKETLGDLLNKIKATDPKPGKQFTEFVPCYLLPDVIAIRTEKGFEISDNSVLPQLHISQYYQNLLAGTQDEEAKEYIKEKLNRAVNLIRNIAQRKNTIRSVSMEIINYQSEFFLERGHIRPMRLKDIAEKTGFHESTISRTVNGKFMLTPRGTFELKAFFETGLTNESGEEISAAEIKDKIQALVKEENKRKPLSDQKIVDALTKEGVSISRRTVAKYRDEMGISGSSQRKEI